MLDFATTSLRVQQRVDLTDRVVIPGFYGKDQAGAIRTLARGGSGISGAAVARALGAHYHNWTDVNGCYDRDPRHHHDAVLIDRLSYSEALLIAQTGVELLHEHAIRLLSTSGLMTVIRNTFDTSGEAGSVVG